jgi:biotin operon repressor
VSNHLTSLVYKLDVGSLLRKSVLVLLADKASDDGSGIWASKQTMADELCCSKQAVWNTLQQFMEEGLLVETGRKQHQNGYTVTYSLLVAKVDALPRVKRWADNPSTALTSKSGGRVNRDDERGQPGLPKPPRTSHSEAKASVRRVTDRWNERSETSGIPSVRILNHSRTQMLMARLKEHGEAAMLEAVNNVHDSEFCRGMKGDGRKADIMLILQPKTLPRVLERFYNQDDKPAPKPLTDEAIRNMERSYVEKGRPDYAAEMRRRYPAAFGDVVGKIIKRSSV